MGAAVARSAPTSEELAVWRRFLQSHATVLGLLAEELEQDSRMSLHQYDVLVQLAEAPDCRLRMADLAGRLLLSRSGLTRLADRMEKEGLIRRESCPSDGRGTFAVLTDEGRARLRAASPGHLDGVARHFVAALTTEELSTLGRILDKLLGSGSSV